MPVLDSMPKEALLPSVPGLVLPKAGRKVPDPVAVLTEREETCAREGDACGSERSAEEPDEGGEPDGMYVWAGEVSIRSAFSRIALPSLYFWDCSYALS